MNKVRFFSFFLILILILGLSSCKNITLDDVTNPVRLFKKLIGQEEKKEKKKKGKKEKGKKEATKKEPPKPPPSQPPPVLTPPVLEQPFPPGPDDDLFRPQDVQNVYDAYDPYSPPQTGTPTIVNQTILPVDPYSPGAGLQAPLTFPGGVPNVSGSQIQASPATPLSNEEMERQVFEMKRDDFVKKLRNQAPMVLLDAIGAPVNFITPTERFVFLGMDHKLLIEDVVLNYRATFPLERKGLEVSVIPTGMDTLCYVKEEENVLEIVRIPQNGDPVGVKSFKADGRFDGVYLLSRQAKEGGLPQESHQIFVYLRDKVQILDLVNPEKSNIVGEIAASGVSQVYPYGDYYFSVQGKQISVIDRKHLSTLSSISLSGDYKILGHREKEGMVFLILALKGDGGIGFKGLQILPLVKNGGGIADLGENIPFNLVADDVALDPTNPLVFLMAGRGLKILDLDKKSLLNGQPFPFAGLKSIRSFQGAAYFTASSQAGKVEFLKNTPTTTPSSEDYRWGIPNLISYSAGFRAVLLTPDNRVLMVPYQKTSQLFYSSQVPQKLLHLSSLELPEKIQGSFSLFKVTDFGFFLYEETTKKIYLVRKDFSVVETLALPSQIVTGFELTQVSNNDFLYLASKKSETGPASTLSVYQVDSSKMVKKLSSLDFTDGGGFKLYQQKKKALLACGAEGVCMLDLDAPRPKMKVMAKVKNQNPKAFARDLSIFPDERKALVYYEVEGASQIAVVSIEENSVRELVILPKLNLSLSQFRGLTFSAGGKKVIFPTEEGISVFNFSVPETPVLSFKWDVGKIEFVDVTNRGQTLCMGGPQGGACSAFK